MPDALFAHPRLAPIYDAFDGERDDLAAYLDLAGELGARRILDVGCGTGSLAILLAGTGRTVVGVDPAEAKVKIDTLTTQLEMSYSLTAKLLQLSIINYV